MYHDYIQPFLVEHHLAIMWGSVAALIGIVYWARKESKDEMKDNDKDES